MARTTRLKTKADVIVELGLERAVELTAKVHACYKEHAKLCRDVCACPKQPRGRGAASPYCWFVGSRKHRYSMDEIQLVCEALYGKARSRDSK